MQVFVLGGFLGSGKTTLLMQIASMFTDKGNKIAILVNEAGEVGVDGATIGGKGYDMLQLPEGCICCSLAGTLHESVIKIQNDFNPDVLIIEPTGLAFPDKVKETLELLNGRMYNYDRIKLVGLVDGPRFKVFVEKKKDFYVRQLAGSDVIAINKIDLIDDSLLEEIKDWLNETFPDAEVIPMCAKDGLNVDKVFKVIE